MAIKVLTEMQNLLPQGGALPQDPATLQPWRGGEGPQAVQGDSHAGGSKDGTGRNSFCLFVAHAGTMQMLCLCIWPLNVHMAGQSTRFSVPLFVVCIVYCTSDQLRANRQCYVCPNSDRQIVAPKRKTAPTESTCICFTAITN